MFQKIYRTFLSTLVVSAFLQVTCPSSSVYAAGPDQKESTKKEEKTPSLKDNKKTDAQHILYAFINPNGDPCKMQVKIIEQSRSKLEEYAKIVYLKTTEPFDLESFNTYGIRSLPSLILSSKGKEVYRFTPGIHQEADLLEQLKKFK